jgi:hypothetical protein
MTARVKSLFKSGAVGSRIPRNGSGLGQGTKGVQGNSVRFEDCCRFQDFKLTFLPTYRMPPESHAWSVYLDITPFSKSAVFSLTEIVLYIGSNPVHLK